MAAGTRPKSPVANRAAEPGSGTVDGVGLQSCAFVGDALPEAGVPSLLNAALLYPHASVNSPMS